MECVGFVQSAACFDPPIWSRFIRSGGVLGRVVGRGAVAAMSGANARGRLSPASGGGGDSEPRSAGSRTRSVSATRGRQGGAGRSCCCARGCRATRRARRTHPRTRSAAGRPRGGLGGRRLGLGRRRLSVRLITRLFPCWKGRLDWLLLMMCLV